MDTGMMPVFALVGSAFLILATARFIFETPNPGQPVA